MNINDVIVQSVQNKARKRGRPRKNSILPVKTKATSNIIKSMIEEDIIVHLPLSKKDVECCNDGEEFIKTDCDEHISSESNDVVIDERQPNINQLMKIIEEKDKIIEKLEEKIRKMMSGCDVDINTTKNVSIHELTDMFEHNDRGELIIPKCTTNACLWDTCEINGTPSFLPDKFSDNKFYVIGCFCSLNCAMAYNLSLDDYRVNERYSLLKWLYGKVHDTIVPSPSFKILKKYGGKLTIEEFRKNLKYNDAEYRIVTPPMSCIHQTLEERIIKTHKKSRQGTILDDLIERK
jgi:NADH:ubiquinone oxidoreductase subunit E